MMKQLERENNALRNKLTPGRQRSMAGAMLMQEGVSPFMLPQTEELPLMSMQVDTEGWNSGEGQASQASERCLLPTCRVGQRSTLRSRLSNGNLTQLFTYMQQRLQRIQSIQALQANSLLVTLWLLLQMLPTAIRSLWSRRALASSRLRSATRKTLQDSSMIFKSLPEIEFSRQEILDKLAQEQRWRLNSSPPGQPSTSLLRHQSGARRTWNRGIPMTRFAAAAVAA